MVRPEEISCADGSSDGNDRCFEESVVLIPHVINVPSGINPSGRRFYRLIGGIVMVIALVSWSCLFIWSGGGGHSTWFWSSSSTTSNHDTRLRINLKGPAVVFHQLDLQTEERIYHNFSFHSNHTGNRSIVLCLHNRNWQVGLSFIQELRCFQSQIPVEVFYCTRDQLSLSYSLILGNQTAVQVKDACEGLFVSSSIKQSFRTSWIRPLALLASSYREVMLVDPHTMFLKNPSHLWDEPRYQATGTLFFHDKLISSSDTSEVLSLLQEHRPRDSFRTYKSVEKSRFSYDIHKSSLWKQKASRNQDPTVVLFNKNVQGRAARYLWHLAINLRFRYELLSDKEVYWLACELANTSYSFSPWGVGIVSALEDIERHANTLCGSTAQYIPTIKSPSDLSFVNINNLLVPSVHFLKSYNMKPYQYYNPNPTHMSPRGLPTLYTGSVYGKECATDIGSIPVTQLFMESLARRRSFYNSFILHANYGLKFCSI